MKRLNLFCRAVLYWAIITSFLPASSFTAEAEAQGQESPFYITPALEGRVEFWRLIFTKYGEHQMLMHHRQHPEIVYSALDFSPMAEKYTGRELSNIKERAVERETERVRQALGRLADGLPPESAFEKRIERLFAQQGINHPAYYREAMDPDQIRTQTGIKERFEAGLQRSGRYMYAIEQIFRREGLPADVGRLPLVESSFDYTAYSSAGAAGIWQFVRSTGKNYLRIDSYIDERRDPILASRAAARYLAHAYERIGNWPLTITSYNHGITGVLRGARETGTTDIARIIKEYKGTGFGFASSNFYTEFLAALDVYRNYKRYFPNLAKEEPWYFDEVRLTRGVSVRELLRMSQTSSEDFERLNPAILDPVIIGRANIPAGFLVKLPRGHGNRVIQQLGSGSVLTLDGANQHFERTLDEAKARGKSKTYVVQPKDSVAGIAKKFGVSREELMSANGLKDAKHIKVGKSLVIPGSGPVVTGKIQEQAAKTVESSEKKPAAEEKAGPKAAASPEAGTGATHKLEPGESLGGVAKHFGVPLPELLELNGITDPKKVRAGRELKIPAGHKAAEKAEPAAPQANSEFDNEPKGEPKAKPAKSEVKSNVKESKGNEATYQVQSGDTLLKIAKKLNVPVDTLKKLNPSAAKSIRAGEQLRYK